MMACAIFCGPPGAVFENLALLYRDEGKLQDAAQVLRRASALREAALGAQHPSTQRLREPLDQIESRQSPV